MMSWGKEIKKRKKELKLEEGMKRVKKELSVKGA